MKGYANLSKPLTELLKKGRFCWSEKAQEAFTAPKSALAPVLTVPDFEKGYVVGTGASKEGIGAELMQENH